MKVALVHDWLTGMRGGERVLERLCLRFPAAPIYTLVWKRGSVSPAIEAHRIRTAFTGWLPGAARLYRWYLPVFPRAIESLRLEGYDVVVSSSHCVAKSVHTPPSTFHLSYIHTPMRYVYELEPLYFPPGKFPWPVSAIIPRELARIRSWDIRTRDRPDAIVCNSEFVRGRIRRHYERDAEVVYPPVDVARFQTAAPLETEFQVARRGAKTPEPAPVLPPKHDTIGRPFYLLAGAFAPYKRAGIAIEACARMDRRVLVVGTGQDERALRKLTRHNVEFIGWASDAHLAELYRQAHALIFPGEEDFGIIPVEALASGCPVIAYGGGGALETVGRGARPEDLARVAAGGSARVAGGVLFGTQSPDGVADGIRLYEQESFDRAELPALAEPFCVERFDQEFNAAFERLHEAWKARAHE